MKTRKLLIALVAILALFAAACGDDDDPVAAGGDDEGGGSDVADGPVIKIGAQNFGESAILAEIYGQVLADHGYEVKQVSVGGFRDVLLGAYERGDVNFSAEYAASLLEFLNGEDVSEATGDADETVGILQGYLDEIGLVATDPAPAVDTNAFVVTKETMESEGYEKISDLPADGAGIKLGAPQDCETNPFCLPGLERVYGVDLSADFVPLESSLVAESLALSLIHI